MIKRGDLFLTSKVRLHCDRSKKSMILTPRSTFPDLKGQAPLRPFVATPSVTCSQLFLTSKVRLHCDAN